MSVSQPVLDEAGLPSHPGAADAVGGGVASELHQRAPVVLTQESRKSMTNAIRGKPSETPKDAESTEVVLRGVLRAVHLEKDWLELYVNDEPVRISGVVETVDDVIGPLVNHSVVVHASRDSKGTYIFRDIELEDSANEA